MPMGTIEFPKENLSKLLNKPGELHSECFHRNRVMSTCEIYNTGHPLKYKYLMSILQKSSIKWIPVTKEY